jgi:hypothetical protein
MWNHHAPYGQARLLRLLRLLLGQSDSEYVPLFPTKCLCTASSTCGFPPECVKLPTNAVPPLLQEICGTHLPRVPHGSYA